MYKVGLVQINNSFSNHNYLPYSVGLLHSYYLAHGKHNDEYEFLPHIYKRDKVDNIVSKLKDCDIIGFSVYIWNINISLQIAKKLREISPNKYIIFGGPQVPDDTEPFLRANPFIGVACNGEGEQVFTKLLDEYIETSTVNGIESINWLDADNKFHKTPRIDRIKDMSTIPSPYLSGVFDNIMQENKEHWLFLSETNRGCPFSCTFCDWGSSVASKVYQFPIERIKSEIDWIADKGIEFVFCCDANFGILPRDIDITKHVIETNKKTTYPRAFSVQNTKNATERAYEIQYLLSKAGLNKGVTVALQSSTPSVLEAIKRDNISTESYNTLQRRFTKDGVETYTDFIIGLPGETFTSFKEGVCQAIDNGQHNRIQFNNLSVLPNAEMGNPEYQKKYGMELVSVRQIAVHISTSEVDEVIEYEDLVVATNAMPREDWVKTRAWSWIVNFYYFNKVLQIPITLLNKLCNIRYYDIFEMLYCVNNQYPILNSISKFFTDKALAIQGGEEEACFSPEYLSIWWPTDELAFINVIKNNLSELYKETWQLFSTLKLDNNDHIIKRAVHLNSELLKLPFEKGQKTLVESSNLLNVYWDTLSGIDTEIKTGLYQYTIYLTNYRSWDEWYKEVVWYGNKKGAYIYKQKDML